MSEVDQGTNDGQMSRLQGETTFAPNVRDYLLAVFNAFTKGRHGTYHNLIFKVSQRLYDEYSLNLLDNQRFTMRLDDNEEEENIGFPPTLCFKSARVMVDPSAKGPYTINVEYEDV